MSARTQSPARGERRLVRDLDRLGRLHEGSEILARRQEGLPGVAEARARPGRIRPRDVLFVFSQLAVMVEAGVPVAVALDGIARQAERLKMRQVLERIGQGVREGQSLSSAMERHLDVFPRSACVLVRAGETSGDLGGMLGRICRLLERDYEMRKKLKSALTYPVVMVCMAAATVVALFAFILPRFRTLYAGKEDVLPGPTRAMLATGDFVKGHYVWLGLGLAAVGAALFSYLRSERGRSQLDSFLLALPVAGDVVRRFSVARSVRTLGALLASGVPVLQALELAGDLAANRRLAEAWARVRERVRDGSRIHEAMVAEPWFPGTLVQMTAVGEAGGTLDSVLVKIGEFYDQEAEAAVAEATSLLEPAMVVIVGGVVGFIAMSIMMPIFRMSQLVH